MLALLCASCALTSKSDSVFFRYFTPERLPARAAAVAPGVDGADHMRLRLGRVSSASYLKDKIAFRDSEYEIGFYEQLLWAERPEAYVRRTVSRALFEEHRIQQIVSGPGLTLDLDLNVLEELRVPRHAARVEVAWMLRSDQVVVAQRTVSVERPISAAKGDAQTTAVAAALGDALGESIDKTVAGVMAQLARGDLPDH